MRLGVLQLILCDSELLGRRKRSCLGVRFASDEGPRLGKLFVYEVLDSTISFFFLLFFLYELLFQSFLLRIKYDHFHRVQPCGKGYLFVLLTLIKRKGSTLGVNFRKEVPATYNSRLATREGVNFNVWDTRAPSSVSVHFRYLVNFIQII